MRLHALPILLTAAVVATPAHAAGDAAAGEQKSTTCVACHGPDGNSTNPEWPKLAGQHASYLEEQLAAFKKGETRSNAMMTGMVANLSEQDMADLAAYYATQPRTGGFAEQEKVELGEKIYRGGNAETGVPACMACHGPAGRGDPAGAIPSLGGQHATYVEQQLRQFREHERSNDPKAMMRDTVRWMTDEEMAAVASYVSGLH